MIKQMRQGKIIVPRGALAQPHELSVAMILAQTGDDVEFIPVGRTHTADIKFRGKEWEIKSPKGSSSRTIENNMRLALKQSDNIIIDLRRIKIPEMKVIREVKRQSKLIKQIKNVNIITKSGKMLEI